MSSGLLGKSPNLRPVLVVSALRSPSSLPGPSRGERAGGVRPTQGGRQVLSLVPRGLVALSSLDVEGPRFSGTSAVATRHLAARRLRPHLRLCVRCFSYLQAAWRLVSGVDIHLICWPDLNPSEFLENASVSLCSEDFQSGGMLEGHIRRAQNSRT